MREFSAGILTLLEASASNPQKHYGEAKGMFLLIYDTFVDGNGNVTPRQQPGAGGGVRGGGS